MENEHRETQQRDAKRTGVALRRDGPQFHAGGVTRCLKMRKAVSVPARSAELLAPAAERAADQAKPEVFIQLALRAVRQTCDAELAYVMVAVESIYQMPEGLHRQSIAVRG